MKGAEEKKIECDVGERCQEECLGPTPMVKTVWSDPYGKDGGLPSTPELTGQFLLWPHYDGS